MINKNLHRGWQSSRYSDVGEGLPGKREMTLNILTDDGFLMVTGHVVPLDTWGINNVEIEAQGLLQHS